jgi:hypothetical protein
MAVAAALLGVPPLPLPLSTEALTATSRHPRAQIAARVCILCVIVLTGRKSQKKNRFRGSGDKK